MLDLMRRGRKQLNWILWLVIIGLGGGMVLLFVDTPSQTTGPLASDAVATVDGNPVTAKEFRLNYSRMYDMYRQAYNLDSSNSGLLKALGLDKQVLNQLVGGEVVRIEAARLGITASDEEVFAAIRNLPSFQENGNFIGSERYHQILAANNMTAAEFEEGLRRDLVRGKFQSLITDGVDVTPDEVQREYVSKNQEAVVQFVALDPANFDKTLQPSEADLKAYFNQNPDKYKTAEQRRVDVMLFDVGGYASDITVTEEDLRRRFQASPGEEQVRASHILLKVDDPSKDAEVRKKAEQVLAEIRAGGDFAKLADKYTEDPSGTGKGGDLSFFARGAMVPEFDAAAFSLPIGQVSDLVKTQFGYHIIKVTEKNTPSFESRKLFLEIESRREQGEKIADQQANKAYAEVNSGKDFAAVAKQYKATVTGTPPFAENEPIPQLGTPVEFTAQIFQLKKIGEIGKPYKAWRGWLIPRLAESTPPRVPEFAVVKDKILADYRSEKSQEIARQRAQEIASAAKGGTLDAAAKKYGAAVTTSKPFKHDGTVDASLPSSAEITSKAFTMNPGDVSDPLHVGPKLVVFQLKEKTPVDMAKFEVEKENVRQGLLSQKKNLLFSSYVGALVDKRKAENKIVINQTLIDQIVG